MRDDDTDRDEPGEAPAPVRSPTGREKFAVLLPALIAFLGLAAMLIIIAVLASMRSS
ncbi:hypothetical protein BH24CHL4_BH24CHL4_03410 [soil metagenome]